MPRVAMITITAGNHPRHNDLRQRSSGAGWTETCPPRASDGRVDLDVARRGVHAVAAELGVAPISADKVYKPAQ
jgi:hypothetical protein